MTLRRLAVLGLIAIAVVTGCTGPQQVPDAGPTGSPAGSGSSPSAQPTAGQPSAQPPDLDPGDLAEEQFAAVRTYLEVRENVESVRYDSREDWRSAVRDATTADGADPVIKRFGPEGTSAARQAGNEHGYVVEPIVGDCSTNPAFPATEDEVAVTCELIDLVTDRDGTVLPGDELDPRWSYVGDRTTPLLILKREDDGWLVGADYTGQAS